VTKKFMLEFVRGLE